MKKFLLMFLCFGGMLMATELRHIQVNGVNIPVIYEKQSNLPLFYLQIIFKGAGSVSDQKSYGLSDITSSLLNEGTKKLGVTKFAEKLEQKALNLSVESGFETMSFILSGMSSEHKKGIEYLKDLMQDPNFTQNALTKVKENSLVSLLEKENDFDYQASRALSSMLFKGSPLEFPSSGTKESIAKISLKEVEDFYKNHIQLKSTIIVVGGDLEFLELEKSLKEVLSKIPNGKEVKISPIQANKTKEQKRQLKDTKQAYIYFGAPFYIKDLKEEIAKAKVASFVLGGSGFGSRIMEEIRVKRGLAYSAYMRLVTGKTLSYATGYLQTSLKNEKEAQKIVQEVVDTFLEKGITQKELDEAKAYLLGSEPLRNETLSQRLNASFSNYYKNLPLEFDSLVLQEIKALSLKEVNDYIKEHQEIKNLTFSIISAD
ncbi:M16 family metallopeptidase [Helicobacter burdigaliensis]|uniref:M16 family metallopeptidase n=1 Tax=Helicobacter burdigaliensis TaxID=2315334 RepID=UPI001E366721|nr:pitrilysin family protein [Helicobacter burdigaliensis]